MTVRLIEGDCLDIMPTLEPNSVDSIITDPPYGLEFMGKDWDHGVPGIHFWAAALRVAKPGAMLLAFGGSRTHHRLMCAIEDAGWEIRDCLMWLYGCLSEDTEILTPDGWKTYDMLFDGCTVMGYNVDQDKLEWEQVQEVYTYAYSDTAYRLQSDHTDQLVSRNHRCLVERGGRYVFKQAETLERKETIPVLESMPELPAGVSVRNQGTGDQEQDLLARMRIPAFEQVQNGEATQAACYADVSAMRSSLRTQERQSHQVLQPGMLRAVAVGEPRDQRASCQNSTYGPGWMDRGQSGQRQRQDERPEQSSLERRRYLLQDTRQLSGRQVCTMPTRVLADGPQGRLCDGTSAGCGASSGPMPQAFRGRASQRPRSNEQRPCQPDAILKQHSTQEIRGKGATRPTLATVTPVHYKGIVWCVRVLTGAFVARRNGHVFVTGNSGFPKSHDISKAIDKAAGAEREVVGTTYKRPGINGQDKGLYQQAPRGDTVITAPATPAAALWDGWGTALKPAYEPIILAMKPRDGTFANNALEHGVAGIWVDGCRVPTNGDKARFPVGVTSDSESIYGGGDGLYEKRPRPADSNPSGRWPANLILDETAAAMLDAQSGERPTGGPGVTQKNDRAVTMSCASHRTRETIGYADTGGASRFFYCAKASRSERTHNGEIENRHPTVKPLALCRWLCRLTKTPAGGVVLDPFMGSGSIPVAAILEGRDVIGVELERESVDVAQQRADAAQNEHRQLTLEEAT